MAQKDINPRESFRVIAPLRVRYGEADMQGIVFNANYLLYADVGITEYFRQLMGNKDKSGFLSKFIDIYGGDNWVRNADVDFRGSAKADDMIDICVRITRFGRTSYTALIHLLRGDELLTVVTLTYVWFDPANEEVAPVSRKFIDDVTAFEAIKPVRASKVQSFSN